jgi:hypothetical protein
LLSDLFFNYEHPAYDKLYVSEDDVTAEQVDAAIRDDAKEFATLYMRDSGVSVEDAAEALAADFMRRV